MAKTPHKRGQSKTLAELLSMSSSIFVDGDRTQRLRDKEQALINELKGVGVCLACALLALLVVTLAAVVGSWLPDWFLVRFC